MSKKENYILEMGARALAARIDEGGFVMNDDELKSLAEKQLEIAHTALNHLMMPLYVNSQRSQFAKQVFDFVKQADDSILAARKDF